MQTLKGKLRTFSLSDNPNEGRRYFNTDINYGVFRRYFHVRMFNPLDNSGEQREAKSRHINKLRSAISNFNYTPASFAVSVTDFSLVNVDEKGNVSIELSEENKLAILDGGSRFAALESLRQEGGRTARMVDDLPVPIIVHLDPDQTKQNFINLNSGLSVNKSLLQSLDLANKRLPADKLAVFGRARELLVLLHTRENSPLCGKISFGEKNDPNTLQASQLWTDHRGSLIGSLFGSVKILEAIEESDEKFFDIYVNLHKWVSDNTDYAKDKGLLAIPPKGNVANWLSIVNTVMYYLFLMKCSDKECSLEEAMFHVGECLKVYGGTVNGDTSRGRRQVLSQGFAQRLFRKLECDEECPTGFHMGIPISLLIITSESSFSVESLPAVNSKKKNKSLSADYAEGVEETKIDSDTDESWED